MDRNFDMKDFDETLLAQMGIGIIFTKKLLSGKTALSFVCPQCGTKTSNTFTAYKGFNTNPVENKRQELLTLGKGLALNRNELNKAFRSFLVVSTCQTCDKSSVWLETTHSETLLYPRVTANIASPSKDMPKEVAEVYKEASKIMQDSPRAAAALLRLATQQLVDDLVPGKQSLDVKIGSLVKKGLDKQVSNALDSLRVFGNNAVHPGEINIDDSPEIASALFEALNLIVDRMITVKRKIDGLYSKIPDSQKEHITHRDSNNKE